MSIRNLFFLKKITFQIKHATGIAKPTEDDLYKAFVEKFRNMEQQGNQLSKDIKDWVKAVKRTYKKKMLLRDN